jgi:hypothetical protein
MSFNDYDENERNTVCYRCCIAAVQLSFPHLAVRDIIDPPHHWFDAALARQIAIHLMVTKFHVPRRRIAIDLNRNRASIGTAMTTIDNRLSDPTFEAAYGDIAERSESYFQIKLQEAA